MSVEDVKKYLSENHYFASDYEDKKLLRLCPYCGQPLPPRGGLCENCRTICRLYGRDKLRILKNGVPVFAPRYYDSKIRDAFMRFKFHRYSAYAANFAFDMLISAMSSEYWKSSLSRGNLIKWRNLL